jgi:protein N-terminal asparagine amidohydrolase
MLERLQDLSLGYFPQGPVQMHLVGSFSDSRGISEELIGNLLTYLIKEVIEIDLLTACIAEQNTVIRGDVAWPIVYGIGVNVKSGDIFPATFTDKGPDLPLRAARIFSGLPEVLILSFF